MSIFAAVLITAFVMAAISVLINNFIPSERKITHEMPHRYGVRDPQFVRSLGQLLGPPIVGGNKVTRLRNGCQIFPAMEKALSEASRTITLETYIWKDGVIASRLTALLTEAAARDVKVHVLLDAAGGQFSGSSVKALREGGVDVSVYHQSNVARFNFRTHRKLLIVDGKRGFIGGVGIADEWMGNADSPEHWRDSHYEVTGPVVAQLQAAFSDNWMKANARVLDGEDFFPALTETGRVPGQTFKSSPQEGSESARLMFLLSLAAAEQTILIANAYFVPDDLTCHTLIEARERGVVVEVVLPGDVSDSRLVRHASRERYGKLLAAGVRIFEYQPTMYHCKYLVVDSLLCSVGSSNFDNRSFRLNDEANLNLLDEALAQEATKDFENDRALAREVTFADWEGRPWSMKVLDKMACLVRSQI